MNNISTLETLNGTAKLGVQPLSLWHWVSRYHNPHMRIGNVIALEPTQVQAILSSGL